MRISLSSAAAGLVLLSVTVAVAGPPAIEGYKDYGALRNRARALAGAELASYTVLTRTLGGREVGLLSIGTGKVDEKPAVLVVGGVNPARPIDSQIALRVAEHLVRAAEDDTAVRGLLDRVTFYFIPQAAPDGSEAFFEKPWREREVNGRPIDDDNDGQSDEDEPGDMNGDGLITMMRVEDADGEYIAHPDDDRVMIKADVKKGERGRYRLLVEGRDNDGDGELNEDPPGGVAFDRNFPFNYPYFTRGAGPHQVSEPETKAVADFAFDHAGIVLVWTLSERDNLLHKWKPDEAAEKKRIKTTLLAADAPYFDKIAKAWEEIRDEKGPPEVAKGEGSFSDWAYFHYGRWSLTTRPWWIPKVETKAEESERGEGTDEKDTEKETTGKQDESEKKSEEKRGAEEVKALAWFEREKIEGFVDWEPIEHPDLRDKKVEIGGFKPFLRANPPAETFEELAEEQYKFLLQLVDMLPRVKIAQARAEALGSGVWRVSVTVENEGVLPTVSAMGRVVRDPQRLQVELELPDGVTFVTGYGRRTIGPLAGAGGRTEPTWLVHDASGKAPALKARVFSPMTGSATAEIELKPNDSK